MILLALIDFLLKNPLYLILTIAGFVIFALYAPYIMAMIKSALISGVITFILFSILFDGFHLDKTFNLDYNSGATVIYIGWAIIGIITYLAIYQDEFYNWGRDYDAEQAQKRQEELIQDISPATGRFKSPLLQPQYVPAKLSEEYLMTPVKPVESINNSINNTEKTEKNVQNNTYSNPCPIQRPVRYYPRKGGIGFDYPQK